MNTSFDLAKALAGSPVILVASEDGRHPLAPRKVTNLVVEGEYLRGDIQNRDGTSIRGTFTKEGNLYLPGQDSDLWLEIGEAYRFPSARVGWVNIYPNRVGSPFLRYASHIFESRQLADEAATSDRISCSPVAWQE